MSTRAIIAMPTADDPLPSPDAKPSGFFGKLLGMRPRPRFAGVYHHNGGAPSELGELLWKLVHARYERQIDRAWAELVTGNPAGWSSLFPLGDDALCRAWDGKSKTTAAAHFAADSDAPETGPVTYQGDPQRDLGFTRPPIGEGTSKMGAAVVYVLCREELVIYAVGEDDVSVTERARLRYGTTPSFDELDERVFGDE